MTSKMRDAAGISIAGNYVEPTRVVHWRGRGSLGLEGGFIMVSDAYGNIADDVAPVAAVSGVSGLFENDDDWNLV